MERIKELQPCCTCIPRMEDTTKISPWRCWANERWQWLILDSSQALEREVLSSSSQIMEREEYNSSEVRDSLSDYGFMLLHTLPLCCFHTYTLLITLSSFSHKLSLLMYSHQTSKPAPQEANKEQQDNQEEQRSYNTTPRSNFPSSTASAHGDLGTIETSALLVKWSLQKHCQGFTFKLFLQ